MSFTQLSAGILAVSFSLTTIGSELVLATDKANGPRIVAADAGKADVASKDKARKSPWETRQMIPSGPKF